MTILLKTYIKQVASYTFTLRKLHICQNSTRYTSKLIHFSIDPVNKGVDPGENIGLSSSTRLTEGDDTDLDVVGNERTARVTLRKNDDIGYKQFEQFSFFFFFFIQ